MKGPSSLGHSNTTKLQIVPWFSKKEWQETYQQAYSTDFELQEKAYTQMSIWKARYPNLPLGVECTMSTLHVKLCDKERGNLNDNGSFYTDKDLQLLYSTAVMRFLNQLTVLSDRKDSMYKMAEQHQLPDWIINLRHEAAHGNSVPALYLLRQAADFILQWLKENYWEAEAHIMEDIIRNPEQQKGRICSEITKMLDLWVTLKMHHWSKVKTINKIEDKDIREQAMDLVTWEGCGIKLSKESGNKDIAEKVKTKRYNDADVEMIEEIGEQLNIEGNREEFTHRIKKAFDPLLRRLFEPLKSKAYKKILYQNCLIDCLAHHKGFCPPIDVEQLSESEVLELMSLMGDLWKDVVEELQSHNLLHCLLKQLLTQDDQLISGQLWLRLVTQLMAGHPPPQPPGTSRLSQMVAECLPFAVNPEALKKRVNLQHMKIQKPLELKPASAQEAEFLQELGRKVIEGPTKLTSQYLHSLLSLREPRLSWEAREKLCALARIYNGRQALRNPPSQVYTSASLVEEGEEEEEGGTSTEGTGILTSPWKLYTGDADWSQCALGVLPW